MSDLYRLLLGVLCVWRITHLLQAEDGPWDVIVRMRRAAGEGFWGRLLDCFYCLSLWLSFPVAMAMGRTAMERTSMWLAFSGGAILLERATDKSAGRRPLVLHEDILQAQYEEDPEE